MGSAIISPCGKYRTRLDRRINDLGCAKGPVAVLAGVNPSVADAFKNDQTIRKDIGFARKLEWSRIIKINKFAFRATDIKELRQAADPVGPGNDDAILQALREADVLVACWGSLAKLPKRLRRRWREMVGMAEQVGKPWMCFGTAKDGQPRHTLMLPYSTPLTVWEPPL